MPNELLRSKSAVRKHARHIRTCEGIGKKRRHHHKHRDTYHTARCLNNKQKSHSPDSKIHRCHCACAQYKLLIFNENIRRCSRSQKRKNIILNMKLRPMLSPCRKKKEYQCETESQMYRTLQLRVKNPENSRIQLKY